jgi:hypothetical protein
MRRYNPTRRNRNIGTEKRGHGRDNRLTIPKVRHGENAYWERLDDAREVRRSISGSILQFFVERTRADCVHACTVDDIALLMSRIPAKDWEGLGAIVLRQPRRKEQALAPIWGRLCYSADLVNRHRQVIYSGPAIVIEAVDPNQEVSFGKSLSVDAAAELERLRSDGHQIVTAHRDHRVRSTLENCRATQLYRTLLHELGHWVDFLERVERPAALAGLDAYEELLTRFHRRPQREKEQFAHSWASESSKRLLTAKLIPFDRQMNRTQLLEDGLNEEDFTAGDSGA